MLYPNLHRLSIGRGEGVDGGGGGVQMYGTHNTLLGAKAPLQALPQELE